MRRMRSGGGWAAVRYTLRMANRVGWRQLWRALRSRNACKTCALGMGGQAGGMVNEAGHFPEVCKKSLQAMVADTQAGLRPEFFARYSPAQLRALSPRELEWCGRPDRAGPGRGRGVVRAPRTQRNGRAARANFPIGLVVDRVTRRRGR